LEVGRDELARLGSAVFDAVGTVRGIDHPVTPAVPTDEVAAHRRSVLHLEGTLGRAVGLSPAGELVVHHGRSYQADRLGAQEVARVHALDGTSSLTQLAPEVIDLLGEVAARDVL
jgi:hypothetical protein